MPSTKPRIMTPRTDGARAGSSIRKNERSRLAPHTSDASSKDGSRARNGPSSSRYSAAVAPRTLTPIIPNHDWMFSGVTPNIACSALSTRPTGCSPSIAQDSPKNSGGMAKISTAIGVTTRRSGVAVRVTVQARYTASVVEIRTVEPDRISEFANACHTALLDSAAVNPDVDQLAWPKPGGAVRKAP